MNPASPACPPLSATTRPATTPAGARTAPAALGVLVALAAACHDSSGGGGGTTQDLEVTRLEVATASPELEHELSVVVELSAESAASGVGLAFLIADAAEVDAGVAEPALEIVGAASIADVRAGTHAYPLRLHLADDDLVEGDYDLVCVVDPVGATPEVDEANNELDSDEIDRVGVRIHLDDAQSATADLAVESVAVDDVLVDVDLTPSVHAPVGTSDEVENGHLGVNVTVRTSGPAVLNGFGLTGLLEVQGAPLIQVVFWDTAQELYVPLITVPTVAAGEPTSVHLDALLNSSARSQLSMLAPPGEVALVSAKLHVIADQLNVHPEYEGGIVVPGDDDGFDNLETVAVLLRLFRGDPVNGRLGGAGELAWDAPYAKDFTNGNVGVGLRFGANAHVGEHGIHAEASGSVPMTLLGSTIDLLDLDAVGLFNPLHKADNGFVVTLEGLNVKLYERRTKEDEQLASAPLVFAQEKSFSTSFTVGPVPMTVRLGARGSVGLEAGASVGGAFAIGLDPALEFEVFGEGGPGGSYLGWTLAGGLGADMQLIEESFHAGITAATTYDSGTSTLSGTITEQVTNSITGPNGRVFLFVTAQGNVLWKTISERWEHTLATWHTFAKEDTLFNQTQALSVHIP